MPDPATPVVDAPSNRPQQDPTALTTEKVQREIEQVASLLRAEYQIAVQRIDAKLDAMDKALLLTEKYPTETDLKLAQHERVWMGEITTINKILEERARARKQWEEASVKSVETAFTAAKEVLETQRHAGEKAIEKSEKATSNELGNLHSLITDLKDNVQRQELTLTNRINTIESKAAGSSNLWAVIVSGLVVIGIVIAAISTIIGMVVSS